MTNLMDCINKFSIIRELSQITIKYKGKQLTVKVGDRYGKLTIEKIVSYYSTNKKKCNGCICRCDCGNYKGPIIISDLIRGHTTSCGCYLLSVITKHGDNRRNGKRSSLYRIWDGMVNRSTKNNKKSSKYYCSKIKDCIDKDWLDYTKFKYWAMENGYKEGLSIDRIDNSKGYFPENCRWILPSLQNLNKTNNRLITYNGITETMKYWSEVTGIHRSTIFHRLKSGKTIPQALGFEKIKERGRGKKK